jgi:hypothetical protein
MKASIGELVLAFAGKAVNPHEPHTVVWAGVVSEKDDVRRVLER